MRILARAFAMDLDTFSKVDVPILIYHTVPEARQPVSSSNRIIARFRFASGFLRRVRPAFSNSGLTSVVLSSFFEPLATTGHNDRSHHLGPLDR